MHMSCQVTGRKESEKGHKDERFVVDPAFDALFTPGPVAVTLCLLPLPPSFS